MKSIITIENRGKIETLTIEHTAPSFIISSILNGIAKVYSRNLTITQIRKEFTYSIESAKIVESSGNYENQFHYDNKKREFVWL